MKIDKVQIEQKLNATSINNILVVGIGLIGGSILKSLIANNFRGCLYGIDLNEDVTRQAHACGLIQNADNNLQIIEEETLVVLSVPVLSLEEAINLVKESFSLQKFVITDTLSSKSKLLKFLESSPELSKRIVLSHPIAGSEKSGLGSSTSDLFKDKLAIISPRNVNLEEDLEKIQNFWEQLGSKVTLLDPEKHDLIFARTSHLPHVITYALMSFLEKDLGKNAFSYSGGSLENYTRIASSDPIMWRDIMISNKNEVLAAINGFKSNLENISDLIESEDPQTIQEFLDFVKDTRDTLMIKEDYL